MIGRPSRPQRSRAESFLLTLGLSIVVLALGCGTPGEGRIDTSWIEYPAAKRVEQVDTYYGVEVADPYRWLEDEASDATRAWIAEQDAITQRFFDQLPEHQETIAYLRDHWLDGVVMVPVRKGNNTFFFAAVGGKPHNVLYVKKGADAEPEVVFDLNENDPDGLRSTQPAITVSPSGRYVGYPIYYAGADAAEIRFYDTEAARELDEFIPASYGSVTAWLPDESGFFYTYLDLATWKGEPAERQPGIYRHRIGTPVEDDALVYARPWDGRYRATAVMADDDKHLLIHDLNVMGARGGWGVRPIEGGANTELTWLIDPAVEYRFAFIGSAGTEVFLSTDYQSPNWRIVAVDINRPGLANLREVIPELEQPISMYGGTNAGNLVLHEGRLYVTYIQDNIHVIRIHDLRGELLSEVDLPFPGRVSTIETRDEDPTIYIGLQSFLVPQSTYACDTETGTLTPVDVPQTPAEFADYVIERVFYSSSDGTRVPMTIIRHREAPRDGTAKVLLYGYGGWGIPLLPAFHNRIHAWLHKGGIYAAANLRGGGEYGDGWHKAGQFFNKQNVFDDFFAAAEYLVNEGYTSHSRIAIIGASNGGLLTAATYNQRPDLFGAVISEVAAVDMLRLQETPVGATVTMELGHPEQSKEMFEYLLRYSPLHNVRHEGPDPPILNIVGENDPRCKPGHIYKYVAELQRMGDPGRLALLRLFRGAGHGSDRRDAQLEWYADELSFAWAMTE
ncbi:MAG: S9 family peptidase [Gemmatimonadota bacterium]|nr:MAG: S9 family peptidase [Gemmatimonadota bacterium]